MLAPLLHPCFMDRFTSTAAWCMVSYSIFAFKELLRAVIHAHPLSSKLPITPQCLLILVSLKSARLDLYMMAATMVSHDHQSGVHSLHIAIPSPHPLNLAVTLEVAESGCNPKHPHCHKVTHAHFSTFEEQSKQEIAAQKAGKHYLTCISAWTDLWISPSYFLTASSCWWQQSYQKSNLQYELGQWWQWLDHSIWRWWWVWWDYQQPLLWAPRSWYSVSGIFLSDAKLILPPRILKRDRRTQVQHVINHAINFNAVLGPCMTAYFAHKHHMGSPGGEPPLGGSHSSLGNVPLPSVFAIDAIDMQCLCFLVTHPI